MCGRFTLTKIDGHGIAQRFDVPMDPEEATLGRYNVCPTERIAVVSEKEGEREMRAARWGLVPGWATQLGKQREPINARSETVAEKKPFADLFKRADRRCLVVADGFGDVAVLPVPGGCGAVQRRDRRRRDAPKFQAQQIGEQVVVAEPCPGGVQRGHEGALVLEPLEDRLGPRAAGE